MKLLSTIAVGLMALATTSSASLLECKQITDGDLGRTLYVDIQAASMTVYTRLKTVGTDYQADIHFQNLDTEGLLEYSERVFGATSAEADEMLAQVRFAMTDDEYRGSLSYASIQGTSTYLIASSLVINRKTGEATEKHIETAVESSGIYTDTIENHYRCTLSQDSTDNLF